ncbi:MAG: AEC family transporter [Clostridiales bacterium]|nr:AEC family transporter [Clostridiales bacterium]
MFDSFIFAVNTVFPIFIIVILGGLLKKIGLIHEGFLADSEKLVFKAALPSMLFLNITGAKGSSVFDGKYILFCVCGTVLSFLLLCVTVPVFLKDDAKRGAFIQGAYRSNFAILGTVLAESMFGQAGVVQISMVMPFTISLYNFFAVLILSVFAPSDKKLTRSQLLKKILKNIVTNPLIISVVLAVIWLAVGIPVPTIMSKSLNYLSGATTVLSLIALGGNFKFSSLKGRAHLAVISAVLKTVVLPAIAVGAAIAVGYRGVELGIIYILFSGPTAVSSYIMAKNMDSDYELAGQILLLSTMICVFTIFLGVFTLRYTGLI